MIIFVKQYEKEKGKAIMKNKLLKNILITLGMAILFHWITKYGSALFGLSLYGGSEDIIGYYAGIYIGQTIIFSCLIFLILNLVYDKKNS